MPDEGGAYPGRVTRAPATDGESRLALVRRARRMHRDLALAHPDAHVELDFTSPLELLVATVLSAQTTDVTVNRVTPALFARYPDAASMAQATPEDVEPFIRTIGLYRNKAKNCVATAKALS